MRPSSASRPISGALKAERFQSARRARRVERSDQPMHQDAAGLAAQRDVAERFIGRRRGG